MSLSLFLPTSNSGGRAARLACALLFLLLSSSAGAAAMPLDEYRSRMHRALTAIDEFWESSETEEGTGAEYLAKMAAVFARVRQLVPTSETIEWEGGRVEVNNSWLVDEAQSFERLPAGSAERDQVFSRVQQRLLALEERLEEVSAKTPSAAAGKEKEKERLKVVLDRKEYLETPPEKTWLERLWDWVKSVWNRLFRGGGGVAAGQASWLSSVIMVLIFVVAGALLAYAVWKLLLARRVDESLKLERRGARVILGEQLAPGQTAADILAEAEALARKGELRAAIRKGYIALLCELGDRKVIALAQHKTNHDYLRAVREQRPLLKEMQKLTASFENHWYGSVPATPDDWTTFRNGYQQTLKTASLLKE